ncbi:CPSF2 [Hepatospora eriocheir]|uniref:CPSF2 n=1 Tax=Hepatospora eriocheir TaxID=1081669 RepID=A0A1X0QA40_9MICR|nr:CPSF2 [Hepatospora eriocheir]
MKSSKFNCQVLYEPLIDNRTEVYCHLLTIGDVNIVVNLGIGNDFDYNIYTDKIKKIITNADGVLLTSFDIKHFGAVGLFTNHKIFCTVPTAVIGKIMLDNVEGKRGNILNNINVTMVKYAQPFKIKNIEIVAYNAGGVVGNSLFNFKIGLNSISLGYNINHASEKYVEGLSEMFLSSVFITNDVYGCVPSMTLTARTKEIETLVNMTVGHVIFIVNITRLIELILTLKQKVCVISNLNIMERVKFMIEWANINNFDLVDFNVPFNKINDKLKKCIIIVSDYGNDIYLGGILRRFNERNDILIDLTDGYKLTNIPVYDIKYEQRIKRYEKTEEVKVEEVKSEVSEFEWYDLNDTVFINDRQTKFFPRKFFKVVEDDFGLEFDFKVENIEEIESQSEENIEEIVEIETFHKTETIRVVPIQTLNVDYFKGVSDLNGIKEIFNNFGVEKLIIVGNEEINFDIMTGFLMDDIKEVYYCDNEKVQIEINSSVTSLVTISDELLNKPFYTLEDKHILVSPVMRTDNIIDVENSKNNLNIALGKLEVKEVVKILQENNFKVSQVYNILTVNENLTITFNDTLEISSYDNTLLISVRELLYKKMLIFSQ